MNENLSQKPEPKCKIKLGTPSPVSFHEVVIPHSTTSSVVTAEQKDIRTPSSAQNVAAPWDEV